MHRTTYTELMDLIQAILPDAAFDQDNDGQIVIYTNLIRVANDELEVLDS